MSAHIYGIDDSQEITPLMVRDAMVNCFYKAHCEDSGIADDEVVNREYCKRLVKKAFEDIQGNFDKPTTSDIHEVMNKLSEFSKGFRSPEIIHEHYAQIKKLVDKLS
ncbi:hypothetical protein C0581_02520 [Candidatus Parcubacteria bacterium]|nr:MAG: hypothetical protein C0581_02520 [Candidatus Parcubacteria bacterium]